MSQAPKRKDAKTSGSSNTNDIEYLDESEQAAVIKRIDDENYKQNKFSRAAFSVMAFAFGMIKIYFGTSQYLYPWQTQPHASFIGEVHQTDVAMWELVSGLSFLFCGCYVNPWFAVDDKVSRNKAWYAAFGTMALLAVLWVQAQGFVFSMTFLWVLGGNIIYTLIVTYVEFIIRSSESEIASLYGLTYKYKKV